MPKNAEKIADVIESCNVEMQVLERKRQWDLSKSGILELLGRIKSCGKQKQELFPFCA